MEIVSKILITLVAIEHLYILYMEMFAWETLGRKSFQRCTERRTLPTKGLAANQRTLQRISCSGINLVFKDFDVDLVH